MAFKPSIYQQKIYDFITDGVGNAVVSAVAGSGKTTTILNALELIPSNKSVLFLAFNKSIASELKERVPSRNNLHVKTVHGFGMTALMRDYSLEVFGGKYRKMLADIIDYLQKGEVKSIKEYKFQKEEMQLVQDMTINFEEEKIENPSGYLNRVVQLCDLGRLNFINIEDRDRGVDQLYDIAYKHNVDIINGECFRAWNLIKLGMSYVEKIDFTDMVFLPNAFNLGTRKYDYVFIDECQDLNTCQRKLMLKAVKYKGGRFIAVGDPHQAIYGFAGADSDSFKKLESLRNTKTLPLSVCYRCGKNIIEKAQDIIPHIQAFDKAKDGEVDYDATPMMLKDGDMVLCRNTYPLVRLCMNLLTSGKKATIMGSDIGRSLIRLIEDTKRKREAWTLQNVFNRLYNDLDKVVDNIVQKEKISNSEARETSLYVQSKEKIEVIEMLAKKCDTPQDVIEQIDNLFGNEDKDGIILSTVHKSKGLEADRVFIIHPELMPSPYANSDWEQVQEENLRYVAYTRAKNYLGFIDKEKFDAYASAQDESMADNVSDVEESVWVGQVGQKSSVILTITTMKDFSGDFGDTNLFEFVDEDGNLFTKFGKIHERYIVSDHDEVDEGVKVAFDATIKKHQEYKGEKVTLISTLSKYSK